MTSPIPLSQVVLFWMVQYCDLHLYVLVAQSRVKDWCFPFLHNEAFSVSAKHKTLNQLDRRVIKEAKLKLTQPCLVELGLGLSLAKMFSPQFLLPHNFGLYVKLKVLTFTFSNFCTQNGIIWFNHSPLCHWPYLQLISEN